MPPHLHLAEAPSGLERPLRPAPPIRVVLAVDHAVIRRSIRRLLEGEADIDVTGEVSDLASVTRDVPRQRPDVLVLDVRLWNGSAVDAVRLLRGQAAGTEIVLLTMDQSAALAQQALDAGAAGFVLKDRADAELLTAVRAAASGDQYVSPRVAAGVDALRRGSRDDLLSARETEVLRLIALGHTGREIATKLRVSKRTVDTVRAELHSRLHAATRAELVQAALRRQLISA
jgi:DNA-binding NarL/FixJ family response regulator